MLIDSLGTILLAFGTFTFIEKLLNRYEVKNKILSIIIYSIFTILTYYFAKQSIFRLLLNWIVLMSLIKYVYKEKYIKSFIITFITYFLLFVFETVAMLIFLIVNKYTNNDIENLLNINFHVNGFIAICMYFCANIKSIFNFLKLFVNTTYTKNRFFTCVFLVISFFITILLSYYIYFDSNFIVTFLSCLFLIIVYNIFIFVYLLSKKKIEDLEFENSEMIGNLKTYEELLSNEKIKNHENKNSLLCIKGIIGEDSSKACEYIDTLIKEVKSENKTIKNLTVNIPSGGLRGLIYQKMLIMKQKGIEPVLDISREVSVEDFSSVDTKLLCDICKIVGVFLDNATEETFKNKDKGIKISLYKDDDNFVISVSNLFKGKLDLDKMYQKGYSTKGGNRGHGLSLVKDLVDKNKRLSHYKQISSNLFTQILEINT